MLRRLCVALTLGILMMAALAQGAAADPINKNAVTLAATCDGQQVEFVVIGGGDFTPAHVVGSTTVFIPEAFDITFTFTPPGGPTETETFTAAKANPQGDVTCNINISETTPEGTFTGVGTVTGFFTPAS
jgi:dihydroxyacetone kinase